MSLLKKAIGSVQPESTFPDDLMSADPPFLPERVQQRCTIEREGQQVDQVLIRWTGLADDEATWMDCAYVRGQFLYFSLEDKVVSAGGAVDSARPWMVYARGKRAVADY